MYVRGLCESTCTAMPFDAVVVLSYTPVISTNALLVVLAVSGIVTLNILLRSGDPLVIAVSLPTI